MKFENLRLVGFKSFVEPTDFEIREGLTGIVGPNGCGKSNLLEALRWVMGATSAKALRSGSMEDVIFSGTKDRPQRNWAEVILTVENTHRNLPADFNHLDTLEVSRRILRKEDGAQSIYKVNGKDVRAKDVQLIFADASTGANSPALVRQGQISELINAKPQNRRRLLEEAAGITGLYSRRHESELRLRAAENNIARLDDVTGELETQRQALARQARQATRYRNLSGHIRKAEALSAFLRCHEATEALSAIEQERSEIFSLLEETARAAAAASANQTRAHEALEPLRMSEAEAGAALHRLQVALEQIEAEAERLQAEKNRLLTDKTRLEEDMSREQSLRRDALDALEALAAEEKNLAEREAAESGRLQEAETRLAAASAALEQAEQAFERASHEAATQDAERRAINSRLAEADNRLARLAREMEQLEIERQEITPDGDEAQLIEAANAALKSAEDDLIEAEANLQSQETRRKQKASEEESARAPMQAAQSILSELKAEAEALTRLIRAGNQGDFDAVIDALRVEAGYETALAAALGDDLTAATEPQAPAHWSSLGAGTSDQSLPGGISPLSDFVEAPSVLAKRLSQIGVVDAAQGQALHGELQQGQRLVSREGDVWRWDGFIAKPEAKTAAAMRLEQQNRLEIVTADLVGAEAAVQAAKTEHEETKTLLAQLIEEEEMGRKAVSLARQQVSAAQSAQITLERDFERQSAKLTALEENITRLKSDHQENLTLRADASRQLETIPDIEHLQESVNTARDVLMKARGEASEARGAASDLQREAQSRADRLEAITRERGLWTARHETALTRLDELQARLEVASEKYQNALNAPDDFSTKRDELFEKISNLEARATAARDDLAEAQKNTVDADRLLKEAEAEAMNAREAKARIEAQHEAAEDRVREAGELARENCNAAPEELLEIAEIKDGEELPTREQIDRKLEKFKRERENLGGVNLRADQEMEEIDERLSLIGSEREDCETAIRKLRAAIGGLNREGRQRLLSAFETVNHNFQSLFTRLFGGGQAELRLIDSDDPLEAGLEIFASPPGKKLSSMSLMSGGEQALTATALIFAVFMANPAPVCVLDEVDAPLDDANVERFCNMLKQMSEETDTRFIIITHHALTMSRMDRLYGVTMVERGISQLVSVDLSNAEQMVAAE
jgi:chromosome segregation protein